jgi:cytochrome c peroxidase
VRLGWLAVGMMVMAGAGCDEDPASVASYDWDLPKGFPTPAVPDDNPMSTEKVELGRRLFFDTRLSDNSTQSCGGCHKQENAFAESLLTSVGSTGQDHFRNAMSLTNVAYNTVQTWSSSVVRTLEAQALIPMFGEDPVELGLSGKEAELFARLEAEPIYQDLFPVAFPEEGGAINLSTITKALAAFERTLISGDSPYDKFWYQQDVAALTQSEVRGLELFLSERTECFHCHGNFNFSDSTAHDSSAFEEFSFHNTGLYNVDGAGAYPSTDRGLMDLTGRDEDMGRFRAPTLRNIALTAPYMHDGSIATLEEVLGHYMAGGRTITDGPNAGDGSMNPLKSNFIKGFTLTDTEREDMLAFLRALTDETFINDPRFANPWVE